MNAVVAKKLEDFFTPYKHQIYKKGEILIRVDDEHKKIFNLLACVVLAIGAVLLFQKSLNASLLLPLEIVLLYPILMMFMTHGDEKKHTAHKH